MATAVEMMGLGMPGAQANKIGYSPVAVTAAGTTAGTATQMPTNFANVTAASSQTGVLLPDDNGPAIVANTSATTAVVYAPSSGTINGGASMNVAQNKTAIFWRYSATLWFGIVTG